LCLDAQIMDGGTARWKALGLLSLAELLALSLWFSASAVLPALSREWALGDGGRAKQCSQHEGRKRAHEALSLSLFERAEDTTTPHAIMRDCLKNSNAVSARPAPRPSTSSR